MVIISPMTLNVKTLNILIRFLSWDIPYRLILDTQTAAYCRVRFETRPVRMRHIEELPVEMRLCGRPTRTRSGGRLLRLVHQLTSWTGRQLDLYRVQHLWERFVDNFDIVNVHKPHTMHLAILFNFHLLSPRTFSTFDITEGNYFCLRVDVELTYFSQRLD